MTGWDVAKTKRLLILSSYGFPIQRHLYCKIYEEFHTWNGFVEWTNLESYIYIWYSVCECRVLLFEDCLFYKGFVFVFVFLVSSLHRTLYLQSSQIYFFRENFYYYRMNNELSVYTL